MAKSHSTAVKNLANQRFGKLVAIERADNRRKRTFWRCQCDCGVICDKATKELLNGDTRSCGCLKLEKLAERSTTHGCAAAGDETPEYRVWKTMLSRCYNQNFPKYATYGARGITVCERWRYDFAAFLEDMGPRPSPRHSIDRIDNDGNYEPGNCRWASLEEQANNRRNNTMLTHDGQTLTIAQWSRETGISYTALVQRIANGWTTEHALTQAVQKKKRKNIP